MFMYAALYRDVQIADHIRGQILLTSARPLDTRFTMNKPWKVILPTPPKTLPSNQYL